MKKAIYLLGGLLLITAVVLSCTSNTSEGPTLATVTTIDVTNTGSTTASTGGNISSDGGFSISSRGVVWGTSPSPTIANSKTIDGTGVGSFSSSITGLTAGSAYYVRAYATNSAGTAYGNEITYTVVTVDGIPTLITVSVNNIATSTALSGGEISSDGGAAITSRGIAWSTSPNPTIANTKTIDGTGVGNFSSSISGLTASTTYYVRAYATNSIGTAYGNQVSFATSASSGSNTVTDIDGNVYPTVQICSQLWMQTNLNVSKYRNGDVIPEVQNIADWNNLTTGAWCYYANQTANGTVYGKLYNWYAVNDPRGLAPAGWHIPSQDEWFMITNCLGGTNPAGKDMKEAGTTHWGAGNTGTNSSGFTALPGGTRTGINDYSGITENGFWWSTTLEDVNFPVTSEVHERNLYTGISTLEQNTSKQAEGLSVRCLRD